MTKHHQRQWCRERCLTIICLIAVGLKWSMNWILDATLNVQKQRASVWSWRTHFNVIINCVFWVLGIKLAGQSQVDGLLRWPCPALANGKGRRWNMAAGGTPASLCACWEFPFARSFLFANPWRVIDIVPEGRVTIPLFNIKQKKTADNVTWLEGREDFPEQKITPRVYAVVPSVTATSWTTGNSTPQKTSLHQTATTLHEECLVFECAHMHKPKQDLCVCVFLL